MRRAAAVAFWLLLAVVSSGYADAADSKIALVIGNAAYVHAPKLRNPEHDATDIAAALKRTGFEVLLGVDQTQQDMREILIEFSRAARTADVALFYYSGHAMQFEGVNYLMPVDAALTDEADLQRLVRADDITASLQYAHKLRILVLDSCRDNPLAQELGRSIGLTRGAVSLAPGLAPIEGRRGMIIAFSTQPGQTAADGTDRNSPYSAAFLRHIETKEEIGTVFRKITDDVHDATAGKQWPELSLSVLGEFYLNGRSATGGGAAADPAATAWEAIRDTSDKAMLETFLKNYPNGFFADLAQKRLTELALGQTDSQVRSSNGQFPFRAITTQSSDLFANPDQFAPSVRGLSVGETLTVEGEVEGAAWYQVRDRTGLEGFIRKDRISRLR